MAAAASTPHPYCFDYSTEFCSEEMSSNIIPNSSNMQVPWINYNINSNIPLLHSNSDCMQLVPQIETGFRDFSLSDDYTHNQVFEPGEDCTGFAVPNFWPNYTYNMCNPMPAEDWAIQGKAGTKGEESDQAKVGRYSVEERKDRILRYLKKRNQRNFNKTIKYACRKTLADKRVRVRGRFAKNNEPCQEEMLITTTDIHDSCYEQNNQLMMKYDEDYNWLEAAIDNLGQFPYLGS